MNNFSIVLKNTFFLTLSEIFLKVVGFLWVVYLARSFNALPDGVALYGRYSFVNSFIAIFSFLPDLGVGLIVIREIAKNHKKAGILVGNSFILNFSLSVLTMILIWIATILLGYSSSLNYLIGIAAMTLFFSTLRSVGIFYFDGIEKMQYSALLNSLNYLLVIIFAFVALQLGLGLSGIFWGMCLATVVSLFITWFFVRKSITPVFMMNASLIRHIFYEGLPIGLAAFAALVYSRIDTIIIAKLLGEHEVGIYNIATPFVFALIQLLNVPFVVAVYPALTRLSRAEHPRFLSAILKSLGIIALWSFPAAMLISLFSPLIPFIFGSKYHEAINILRILIFYVPFASLSALLYKILLILNKQYLYLFISILGALIDIVANIVLIPNLGLLGAVYSSVLTQFLLFLFYSCVVVWLLRARKAL